MNNTTKLINVPSMDVGDLISKLTDSYSAIIRQGIPVKEFPSVMLWGPPGVGKSQAVHQVAGNLEALTSKKVVVTEVRLLLFNPIDLRGIPTSNADKTLAVWLKPEIFQMDERDDVVNILFLDEITAAPQSVQAAAYQLTLDRAVGEHKLAENCIVIAAGNRTGDHSVAYKMPKALANRLLHIEVEPSFSSWSKWGVDKKINPKVLGFLSFKQDYLMDFHPEEEDVAFPTPRSWEMVSNLLNNVSDDVEEMYALISGLVGTGAAAEFRTWSNVYQDLPRIEDIFDGLNPSIPKRADTIYALISSMVSYAGEHKDEMDKMENSIRYALRLPPDFATVLLNDYMYLEKNYRQKLMDIPEFYDWYRRRGVMLNGTV